jgi:hypothetical protein
LAEKWERQADQLREEAENLVGEEPLGEETPEGMPTHRPKCETDGTPKPKAQRNFTDPESRIMEKGGEFLQGYNCQLLVDEANQVIVAQGVVNQSPDNGNFGPMVEKATRNAGESPEAVLADSGYWSEEAPEQAEDAGTEAYIATGRQPHGKKEPTCSGDPPGDPPGNPPEEATAQEIMSHKLRTRDGIDRYAKRKGIVEPAIGQVKECGDFRQFYLRGHRKARKEWALVCTGHNLRKLYGAMQEAGQRAGTVLG